MGCKKVAIYSLIGGAIVGFHCAMFNNSLDNKIKTLKRQLNNLNRKLNNALNSMSEENLKKYKQELIDGYENIKKKVENITIEDIKDAGNNLVNNIMDSIRNLKQKIATCLE